MRATLSSTSSRSSWKRRLAGARPATVRSSAAAALRRAPRGGSRVRARGAPAAARARARPSPGGARARAASPAARARTNSAASSRRPLQARVAARPRPRALSSARPRAPSSSISSTMKASGASVSSPPAALRCSADEALDPFARLGRHLRRLGRGRQARDQVELAPARDLDHAREVRLAQLDRRPRERAHDGGRVLRVDEQAHPREHVAHLRPAQEARTSRGRLAGRAAGAQARARFGRRAPSKDTSAWQMRSRQRARRARYLRSAEAAGLRSCQWTRSIGAQRSGSASGSPARRRRRRARRVGRAARIRLRAARERLQRPRRAERAAAARGRRPLGVDRREPADDAPAARRR